MVRSLIWYKLWHRIRIPKIWHVLLTIHCLSITCVGHLLGVICEKKKGAGEGSISSQPSPTPKNKGKIGTHCLILMRIRTFV